MQRHYIWFLHLSVLRHPKTNWPVSVFASDDKESAEKLFEKFFASLGTSPSFGAHARPPRCATGFLGQNDVWLAHTHPAAVIL